MTAPSTHNFIQDVLQELQRARFEFPHNRHTFACLVEEVGELGKALVEHDLETEIAVAVYEEAVQVACMALRVALEGDSDFPKYRGKP